MCAAANNTRHRVVATVLINGFAAPDDTLQLVLMGWQRAAEASAAYVLPPFLW
jgi:hypothetical protein